MKRLLKLAIVMLAAMMVLTGCGNNGETETETETEEETISGTLTLAGSTSMEKLCEALSESFMEEYEDVTVTVEYTGSGAGIESLTSGTIDIGNSSRALKD